MKYPLYYRRRFRRRRGGGAISKPTSILKLYGFLMGLFLALTAMILTADAVARKCSTDTLYRVQSVEETVEARKVHHRTVNFRCFELVLENLQTGETMETSYCISEKASSDLVISSGDILRYNDYTRGYEEIELSSVVNFAKSGE